MYAAGLTAIGMVRDHNEDAIFSSTKPVGPLPNLFVVADGMGGHNAGEIASSKSLVYSQDFIHNSTYPISTQPEDILDILVTAAHQANRDVFDLSVSNPSYHGMGTTFTACVVADEVLAIAHIGDSRIYTVGTEGIVQITRDHTFVQELVDAGNIAPHEAKIHPQRNMLTRVLGCDPSTQAEGTLHKLSGVDSILLCSDGLTDMLSDENIHTIVNQQTPPTARAEALVAAANKQGGIDNISAIIIDICEVIIDSETTDKEGEDR